MGGYVTALRAGGRRLPVRIRPGVAPESGVRRRAGEPHSRCARRATRTMYATRVPVLLTAHSLPKRVVDREPEYVEQLKETAHAVADAAQLAPERWRSSIRAPAIRPRSGSSPTCSTSCPSSPRRGSSDVVVAPVQFLADHLETLYDVDVAGREQAESAGITEFVRVDAPNVEPRLCRGARKRGPRRTGGMGQHPRGGDRVIRIGTRASALARAQTAARRRCSARGSPRHRHRGRAHLDQRRPQPAHEPAQCRLGYRRLRQRARSRAAARRSRPRSPQPQGRAARAVRGPDSSPPCPCARIRSTCS